MVIDEFDGQLVFAILWGLCLMASFIGYGWLLARFLKIPLNPSPLAEIGLYAGWGLSLWIAIGGVLVFGSLVSPQSVILLVTGGLVIAIYALLKHPYQDGLNRLDIPARLVWRFLVLEALILYVSHASNFLYNPNDDMVIYNVFPQQMLQTGTLIDPFSWRRMTAYGGQPFLQAACMCVLPPEYMNLFDRGICPFLFFILLANIVWFKKLEKSTIALLLLAVAQVIPSPAVNESSQGSALFLVLVLAATCQKLFILKVDPVRLGFLVGLVASAYCALKAEHLIGLLCFFGFLYSYEIFSGRHITRCVKETFWISIFAVCLLLLWARVLFLSNGTFFYPIFHGNQPLDHPLARLDKPFLWNIGWLLHYLPSSVPILISLFAMAMASEIAERKVLLPLCGAAVVQLIVVGYLMASKADQNVAIYRYSYGMLVAASFLSLLSALEASKRSEALVASTNDDTKWSHGRFINKLAVLVILSMVLFNLKDTLSDLYKVERGGLINYSPGPWTDQFRQYRAMQAAVPPGEPILVFTNFPFLFDFQRNPIYVGDLPGQSSPPPYMPFFKGAGPLENYLNGLGINYIIHSDFNVPGQLISGKFAEYSRPFWNGMSHWPHELWRAHAPFFLDLMDNIESIEKNRNVIHDSDLTLFCLRQKPDATTR